MTKRPELRIDMTDWHPGDWPLMKAVKVDTSDDEHLIRVYVDEDEAEKVAKDMIQHHFEMLFGVEDGGSWACFTLREEGLEFSADILSRPILIPWDRLWLRDKATLVALERWIEEQKKELDRG